MFTVLLILLLANKKTSLCLFLFFLIIFKNILTIPLLLTHSIPNIPKTSFLILALAILTVTPISVATEGIKTTPLSVDKTNSLNQLYRMLQYNYSVFCLLFVIYLFL